jgi:hypothetical protein
MMGQKLKIFSEEEFQYDSQSDTYRCPAGNRLKPKSLHLNRQSRDCGAPKKVCAACLIRDQCTRNKSGRTIPRHLRQEELDRMREASRSAWAKRGIKTFVQNVLGTIRYRMTTLAGGGIGHWVTEIYGSKR